MKLLALDGAGSLMLAIGVILLIGEPTAFLPWELDYDEIGLGLIIVGVMFMLPLLWHLVGLVRHMSRRLPQQ